MFVWNVKQIGFDAPVQDMATQALAFLRLGQVRGGSSWREKQKNTIFIHSLPRVTMEDQSGSIQG